MFHRIVDCWFYGVTSVFLAAYLAMCVSIGVGMFDDGHTVAAIPVSAGLGLAGAGQAVLVARKERRRRRLKGAMEREINRLNVEITLARSALDRMRSGGKQSKPA